MQKIINTFSQKKKQLPVHEWMAITVASGAMLALAFMTTETSCETIAKEYQAQIPHKTSRTARQDICEEEPLWITVYVTGAVEKPGEIQVESGTRVVDLKNKIVFSQEADKRYLNKKRKLKNHETLDIPSRKAKESKRGKSRA